MFAFGFVLRTQKADVHFRFLLGLSSGVLVGLGQATPAVPAVPGGGHTEELHPSEDVLAAAVRRAMQTFDFWFVQCLACSARPFLWCSFCWTGTGAQVTPAATGGQRKDANTKATATPQASRDALDAAVRHAESHF